MASRTCGPAVTFGACATSQAEVIVAILALQATFIADVRTSLAKQAVFTLRLCFTFHTCIVALRTHRLAITVSTPVAIVAPVIRFAFRASQPAVLTECRAVLTSMTSLALCFFFAQTTALMTRWAGGIPITGRTLITAQAPAIVTLTADLAASLTKCCTILAIVTGSTLTFFPTLQASLLAAGAGGFTVTSATPVTAITPCVFITLAAEFITSITDGRAVIASVAVFALRFRSALITSLSAVRTHSPTVAGGTLVAVNAPSAVTLGADLSAIVAQICTSCAHTALPALRLITA